MKVDVLPVIVMKRKIAHAYVMFLTNSVCFPGKDFTKDSTVADFYDIPLTELLALKKGGANPSSKLVNGVHEMFKGYYQRSEIDSYLVQPFAT
jgi:hypothetical protein